MLDKIIQEKLPYLNKYFSILFEEIKLGKRKFPQGIVLEGTDLEMQFLFANELARVLNCENNQLEFCECINCKWIRDFAHPAVTFVTPLHFKPDKDDTKTTISVKQARQIESSLALSSDFHRFYILFFSKEYEYEENELEIFEKMGYKTDINFSIEGLNFKNFNEQSANTLLKSLEEPPERTTFVFLCKSKDEILSTITSRCQIFKINGSKQNEDYTLIKSILEKYPNYSLYEVFEIVDGFIKIANENYLTVSSLLHMMIAYLKDLMVANFSNDRLCDKITYDISLIKDTLIHLKASVNERVALETLFLKILGENFEK
ncbi:hypothetical protein IJ670_03245 [bacterium]|nr:hypothetical protein [bacterium]